MHADLAWTLKRLQCANHRGEFHAVVGGTGIPAEQFLLAPGAGKPGAPTARSRVALAGAVGVDITAAIGNAYENGLRGEVEFGYRKSDMDEFDSDYGSGSINGDVSTISLMVNGYYDFMPKETICPFICAGIGYANVEGDIDELGSEDDNVFAYQVAVGVAFAINPQTKIDVQYRYFDTDDSGFDDLEVEYGTHNAMLGVRYSF